MLVAGAIAGLAVGLAAVYGIAGLTGNAGGDVACRPAVDLARKIAPLATGEVAAVNVAKQPLRLPDLAFQDGDGKPVTLADFRGRTVLLNLWATWCVPCRKEMPALDALERKLGGADFQVVAVNIDTRDADKPKRVSAARSASASSPISPTPAPRCSRISNRSAAPSACRPRMLIDPQGCELGTIAGPAEWASPQAQKLIEAALKK